MGSLGSVGAISEGMVSQCSRHSSPEFVYLSGPVMGNNISLIVISNLKVLMLVVRYVRSLE